MDSGQIMLMDPCYVEKGLDYYGVCTAHSVAADGTPADYEDNSTFDGKRYYQGIGGPVRQPGMHGVVTSTGWGDGLYPVYAEVRDGRVASVTIEFMEDEDTDEDWF